MTQFSDLIDAKERVRADGRTVDHVELTPSMISEVMGDAIGDSTVDRGDAISTTAGVDVDIGKKNVIVTDDGSTYEF